MDCFRGTNRRRTVIVIVTFLSQQFSGSGFIAGYLPCFFTIAGVANPIGIAQISYSIQLLGNIISWFLVDRIGRRPLAVHGYIIMTATLLVIGGLGTAKNSKAVTNAVIALMSFWGFLVSSLLLHDAPRRFCQSLQTLIADRTNLHSVPSLTRLAEKLQLPVFARRPSLSTSCALQRLCASSLRSPHCSSTLPTPIWVPKSLSSSSQCLLLSASTCIFAFLKWKDVPTWSWRRCFRTRCPHGSSRATSAMSLLFGVQSMKRLPRLCTKKVLDLHCETRQP